MMGGTAKHCIDQYIIVFHYCSLWGNTVMPGGLRARLCHAFLVFTRPNDDDNDNEIYIDCT